MTNILLTMKNCAHSTFACLCLAAILVFVHVNFWLCLTGAFFETETNRPKHLPPNLHAIEKYHVWIHLSFMYKSRKPKVWLYLFFVLWRSHVLCLEKKTTTTSESVFMTRRSFLNPAQMKNNHRLTCIGCRRHEIYWQTNNWDSLKSCCFKLSGKLYTFPLTFCELRFCLTIFQWTKPRTCLGRS